MGLLSAADLPSRRVFLDQGQFEEETSSAPEMGTEVSGGTVEVAVNDLMAADGVRSGPTVTAIRRAVVYVSRDGLAPQSEMSSRDFGLIQIFSMGTCPSWNLWTSLMASLSRRFPRNGPIANISAARIRHLGDLRHFQSAICLVESSSSGLFLPTLTSVLPDNCVYAICGPVVAARQATATVLGGIAPLRPEKGDPTARDQVRAFLRRDTSVVSWVK